MLLLHLDKTQRNKLYLVSPVYCPHRISVNFSPLSDLNNKLAQLQKSDPGKFKQVTVNTAKQLKDASG